MAEKLYYGIDLGTTNSAIAYGYISGENKVNTQICKINRSSKEGGIVSSETLPSVVYYKKDVRKNELKTIVGDFAKNQYGKKFGSVVKSVKNHMGNPEEIKLDEKIGNKSPEEISSLVLKHLLLGIKDKLNLAELPENVIITIPASFDSDQCNATLKAAELAGLNVKDENGEYLKNVLLYEPKAAIYNVANLVTTGDVPKSTIDFSTKKNVLVFDLGGGTLDVAMYEVFNNEEYNFPIINELAVGRYTRIGGDDFDSLLAEDLVDKFLEYTGYSKTEVNRTELLQLMESRAEYLKVELSEKVFNSRFSGNAISDEEEFEISEMDIYKGNEFEAYFTKKEIEDILSPLMGNHLEKEDVKRIDYLTSQKDVNNIIFPILDVLAKAKENGFNTDIDAIILNGGMTKFYLIKDRIEKFFGITPITVNDPDLAVAKGAAFYQYCLEKVGMNRNVFGEKKAGTKASENEGSKENTSSENKNSGTLLQLGFSIVNDDINLGLTKGYVRKVIKAGTKLPTGDVELAPFSLPEDTDNIELPIYLGRGNRTELPNRKISTRKIMLEKKYPRGTEVILVANVDESKTLRLSGYVGKDKKEKIEVIIDTVKSSEDAKKGIKIEAEVIEELKASVEIESLRVNTEMLEGIKRRRKPGKAMHPVDKQKQEAAKYKISQTIGKIKSCGNKADFEKLVLEKMNQYDNTKIIKSHLIDLGQNIYPHMSEAGKDEFVRHCKGMLNFHSMMNNRNKDAIIKAIVALGTVKDSSSQELLEEMIEDPSGRVYIVNLVRALGEISADNELLATKFLSIDIDSKEIDPYIHAVGRSFSRTVSGRTDREVEKIVEKLMKILKLEKQNKDMALIAIGEICNTLEGVSYKLDESFIEKIGKELSSYIRECAEEVHREKARLVLDIVFGLDLTEEQKMEWEALLHKK